MGGERSLRAKAKSPFSGNHSSGEKCWPRAPVSLAEEGCLVASGRKAAVNLGLRKPSEPNSTYWLQLTKWC